MEQLFRTDGLLEPMFVLWSSPGPDHRKFGLTDTRPMPELNKNIMPDAR